MRETVINRELWRGNARKEANVSQGAYMCLQ